MGLHHEGIAPSVQLQFRPHVVLLHPSTQSEVTIVIVYFLCGLCTLYAPPPKKIQSPPPPLGGCRATGLGPVRGWCGARNHVPQSL